VLAFQLQSIQWFYRHESHHPDTFTEWTGMKRWPGGFIQTLVTKTDDQHRAGKDLENPK
jgi:hypothetical protein